MTWLETKQKLCDVAHLLDQVSTTDVAWIGAGHLAGTYKWMWTDAANSLFFGKEYISLYLDFGFWNQPDLFCNCTTDNPNAGADTHVIQSLHDN